MNYFAQIQVKSSWRTSKPRFAVLLNPPGALYVYESENHFYRGCRPLWTVKTSELMVGAIICMHVAGKNMYCLGIAGAIQVELRSEDEEELSRLRLKLEEFQRIDYSGAQTEVIVEPQNELQLVRDVKQILTEPQADSVELEMRQKGMAHSAEA